MQPILPPLEPNPQNKARREPGNITVGVRRPVLVSGLGWP